MSPEKMFDISGQHSGIYYDVSFTLSCATFDVLIFLQMAKFVTVLLTFTETGISERKWQNQLISFSTAIC